MEAQSEHVCMLSRCPKSIKSALLVGKEGANKNRRRKDSVQTEREREMFFSEQFSLV